MKELAGKTGKVIGPPGCGKTTEILRLVEAAVDRYLPHRIGAISFTKAAVNEIKNRVVKKSGNKMQLQNIRTLHSQCFHLLSMTNNRVAEANIKHFNEEYPNYAIINNVNGDEHQQDSFRIKNKFAEIQVNRNRMIPEEKWNEDIIGMWHTWKKWMEENNLIDFTGMLEAAHESKIIPDIDILFVDEAQDLTPLQFAVVQNWADKATYTVFAGDADQCIFRFQGAVPEVFRDLEHNWDKPLVQSFRVSPAVHAYAQMVIRQAKNRNDIEYNPCLDYGTGRVYTTTVPDLSLDGSHMIICRCNYQVHQWIDWLVKQGELWHNPYRPADKSWNPTGTNSWLAVNAYNTITTGKDISKESFLLMVREMIAKDNIVRGGKKKVLEAELPKTIDIFTMYEYGFTAEFIDKKRPLGQVFKLKGKGVHLIETAQKPRVIVGTVHSVKGGETDHVWFDTSVPAVIYKSIKFGSELARYDEARVAYVAATRARKTLGLLRSKTWNPILPKV